MTEPNCDMPWEIYLDWLQDQGIEDLRGIEISGLVFADEFRLYHSLHNGSSARGEGYRDRIGYFQDGTEDFSPHEGEGFYSPGHRGEGKVMSFDVYWTGDGSQ